MLGGRWSYGTSTVGITIWRFYRHVYMDVDRRTGVICIRVKRKEGNIYKVADQLDQRPAERIIKMLDATWLLRSNIGADVGANVFDMKFWVAHFDENEGTDPVGRIA